MFYMQCCVIVYVYIPLQVTPKDDEQKIRRLPEAKSNFYTKDYNSNQFQANIKNEETASLQVRM